MSKDTKPQVDSVDEDQTDDLPANKIKTEDVGTLKKKLTITIARERIDAKRDEMFGELSSSAQVPGFRVGRAPRRLLEKRFGKEVSSDVRNAIVADAVGKAIDDSELKSIGEPNIDLEKIELPETGELEFSFEIEVAPEFDLPKIDGIKVEKQSPELSDELVDKQLEQLAASSARFEETDDAAAEEDVVTAGATITIEGVDEPLDRPGQMLRVAPGQIEGLPLVDLGKELTGKKAGDSARLEITIPQGHPNEDWQGKKATIEIQISQIRKRIVPTIDEGFATAAGFESLDELKDHMRSRIEVQMGIQQKRDMRRQIEENLLENTKFDLPDGLINRHTARVLQKRYVDLLQQGIPRDKIDENLTQLQAAATEQAQRDLKLQFILDKIAEDKELEITADEVNSRIAQMAQMYDRRPERVRQELAADGSLEQLAEVMRGEKALDALLESAEVKEVKPKAEPKKADQKKAAKKTAKKSEDKAEKKTAKKPAEKTAKKAAKTKKE